MHDTFTEFHVASLKEPQPLHPEIYNLFLLADLALQLDGYVSNQPQPSNEAMLHVFGAGKGEYAPKLDMIIKRIAQGYTITNNTYQKPDLGDKTPIFTYSDTLFLDKEKIKAAFLL